MEPYSCIAPYVNVYSQDQILLKEYSIVSQGAHLCTGSHDFNDPDFKLYTKPIVIGKHSWVAAEAFIGPGVTVAEYSVIGARSVVFKDTQPYGIYVGNPAVFIKRRKLNEA